MAQARVHLVDGTFELFRCFHGAPRATNPAGREVGAARGFLATIASLVFDPEVTHVAVAFDSVVAPPGSVRAASRGGSADQVIGSQAPLAAAATRALGVPVWPAGRYQADELLATAAARFSAEPEVEQVAICSSDNDFDQCVRGTRVVVLNRIRREVTDDDAVRAKWGVTPQQIPDLFALVGDRSDGLPGVPGWGKASAAAVLGRWGSLDAIPDEHLSWDVPVRGAARLAASLHEHREEALLCRDLSQLRTDLPLRATLDDLEWRGPHRARLEALCAELGDTSVLDRLTADPADPSGAGAPDVPGA